MRIVISCVFLCSLVLSSCARSPVLAPSFVPTFSQTPPVARTDVPSATLAIAATPTLNNKTIILTPDDVFSLPMQKAWNTPDSSDFCEHLPAPQAVTNPDRFSLLSGRFVLCSHTDLPWIVNIVMDLDTGSLVSTDDERGDIVLGSSGGGENPIYGVLGWNNAYINSAYVLEKYANHSGANHLSYEYCEKVLRNQTDETDQGGIYVAEQFVGAIACVRTTEGKIALIRAEKIYPPATLSVEFSFAILEGE